MFYHLETLGLSALCQDPVNLRCVVISPWQSQTPLLSSGEALDHVVGCGRHWKLYPERPKSFLGCILQSPSKNACEQVH